MMRDSHSHGDNNSFLYLFDKTKKPISPICKSKAVYLLLNASPIAIPAKIQYIFFCWKMALWRQIKLSVQNKIKGTSGVELKERMEINGVETIKTILRQTLPEGKNSVASW